MPRIQIPDYPHHVVMRCNNREALFSQASDVHKFLHLLGYFKKRHNYRLYAYTIMSNHVHLLLDPGHKVPLAEAMRDIMANFAKWFNWKHSRRGHFWASRYHATVIQDDSYALTCMRYIHRNPVRAGIVKVAWEYPWSSVRHNAFGETDSLIDDLPSFLGLSPYPKVRYRQYRHWVETPFEHKADKKFFYDAFMGSDPFRDRMRARFGLLGRGSRGKFP